MSNTKVVLKTMVLALAGSVVVFCAVSPLLADRWSIETTRTIAAPPDRVRALFGDFDEWEKWSTYKVAPGVQVERRVDGAPGTPGHRVTWSDPGGATWLTLVAVDDGGLRFEQRSRAAADPHDTLVSRGHVTWRAEGAGTRVTWRDEGAWSHYFERW